MASKFLVRISSKSRVDRERNELRRKGYKVFVKTVNRGKTKADPNRREKINIRDRQRTGDYIYRYI